MNFRIVAGHIMLWGAIIGALIVSSYRVTGTGDVFAAISIVVPFWIAPAIYLVNSRMLLRENEEDRVSHEVKILKLKLERAKLNKEFIGIPPNLNSK